MADDERRAEIEAVSPAEVEAGVAVLRAMLGEALGTDEEVRDMALGVLLGAARVRDARGDDEPCSECGRTKGHADWCSLGAREWWERIRDKECLDRVRDARGDNEAERLRDALKRIAYGLEGEMGRYDAPRDNTWWGRIALEALARSPQDEDHETVETLRDENERLREALAAQTANCNRLIDAHFSEANAAIFPGKGAASVEQARADAAKPARSSQGEDHETARPEQPPPDALGGQPPAKP